mmetsp:Transcript_9095/g.20341  ORF Transcript_9095/g.20341 Transcript_9095/m.20341 type:complete len:336 (+) Transcript_9095:63-1070(+)
MWKPDEVQAIRWLGSFEAKPGKKFTHMSSLGDADSICSSGKLQVPDDEQTQQLLLQVVAEFYRRGKPLCLVERQTPLRPLVEDFDCVTSVGGPQLPNTLVHSADDNYRFWARRADILHRLFPRVKILQLNLFSSSGWNKKAGAWKLSFHLVWPDLIIDRSRNHQVLLATRQAMAAAVAEEPWLQELEQTLLEAHPDNTWDAVFDDSAMTSNSLRMPYSDKGYDDPHGARLIEDRPLRAVGIFRFHFARLARLNGVRTLPRTEVICDREDEHSVEEWIWHGSARRPRLGEGAPELTPWVSPKVVGLAAPLNPQYKGLEQPVAEEDGAGDGVDGPLA